MIVFSYSKLSHADVVDLLLVKCEWIFSCLFLFINEGECSENFQVIW